MSCLVREGGALIVTVKLRQDHQLVLMFSSEFHEVCCPSMSIKILNYVCTCSSPMVSGSKGCPASCLHKPQRQYLDSQPKWRNNRQMYRKIRTADFPRILDAGEL